MIHNKGNIHLVFLFVLVLIFSLGVGYFYLQNKNMVGPKSGVSQKTDKTVGKYPTSGSVASLVFSPNGEHFALLSNSKNNSAETLIVDGTEIQKPGIKFSSPVYSPNGKLAYVEIKNGKYFANYDSQLGKAYDWISFLAFSSDSSVFGYVAKKSGKWLIVANDQENPALGFDVYHLSLTSDPQKFAYVGKQGVGESLSEFVVLNGVKGKTYKYASDLTFSVDGKQFVYSGLAIKDKNGSVSEGSMVKNGLEIGKSLGVSYSGLTFSPDGKQFAYAKIDSGKWSIYLNDQKVMGDLNSVSLLRFSKDGRHFGFVDGERRIIVDGKEVFSDSNNSIKYFNFNDDGKSFFLDFVDNSTSTLIKRSVSI